MCGIFGIIDSNKIKPEKLIKISKILHHRGPDDEVFLLFNKNRFNEYKGDDSPATLKLKHISQADDNYYSAFLHRRLSIIDLSDNGHQPMAYNNCNLWIILNGEIYNYIEIKEELQQKGYKFRSTSDTEVVLAAYTEWGEKCVERFNGMWALAIWDIKKQKLFLSRDRIGIKPLYYYVNIDSIIFSSEIKGILSYYNQTVKLNENKIREYLVKGQIIVGESEKTIFDGIMQLLPGHNLIYRDYNANIFKYWDLKINISNNSRDYHIEKFKELFYNSLKFRLRSDVEVGSCLSGGIDSSSIVSFASVSFKKQFHTFSAVWTGTQHDESKFMKLVNEQYNSKSNYIIAETENIIKLIDDITWHQEIPIAGSSLIAQWYIMKKARAQKVPVLLDGQGADEILSGYPVYLNAYVNELIYNFKIHSLFDFLKNSEYTGLGFKKIVKKQIKKLFFQGSITSLLPINNAEYSKYNSSIKYHSPIDSNFLPSFLKEHIQKTNLPSLLHYEDRNSMAHSIEARVPYLDYRLIEFAVNIPSEHKIGNGFTKTILRDAMKDYVPKEILLRRDKIGFSTPIEEKLLEEKSEMYQYMSNHLYSSDLWASGIIDKSQYEPKHLFALYSLVRFIDIFN